MCASGRCVLVLLLTTAARAAAQGGPPYITDDPFTPGPKKWEINLAPTLERRPGQYVMQTPDFDINYGVGERIQLKVETAWIYCKFESQQRSAMDNVHVGVKWRFLDSKSAPFDVSTYPQFDFNAVTHTELGMLDRDTEFLLPIEVAKKVLSFQLVAEVGYNRVFDEADNWTYGMIVTHVIGNVNAGVELHRETAVDLSEDELIANIGAVIALPRGNNLLVSAGHTLRKPGADDPNVFAYLGLQLHLPMR